MAYPNGPLLRVLAQRVLSNLDYIDDRAPKWDRVSSTRNDAPFTDTQLLISALGFLVFPHERTPDALGDLLLDYNKSDKLSEVMTIVYEKSAGQAIEVQGDDGEAVSVDPGSIKSLPRLLRNSIAHFNIRPIETDGGRFGGVRIWNTNPQGGQITFVADMKFDQLRELARFVLNAFSDGHPPKNIDDPIDPLEQLKKEQTAPRKRKPPRIIEKRWIDALKLADGNAIKAKTWIDKTLKSALDESGGGRL